MRLLRPSKDSIYAQFARIGKALASEKRLLVLDLLAQAPRHVEALAREAWMPIASVSQHLQVLRNAGLIQSEREGTRIVYRVADESVLRLWLALRSVAESQLAEVDVIFGVLKGDRSREKVASFDEMALLLDGREAFLLDVRPLIEFESGHIPGAASVPVDELPYRTGELPREQFVLVYSRGRYCLLADKAVAVLRMRGFRASRLKDGWSEWKAEGRASLSLAAS